jgi:hypothetical protein
MLSIFEVRNKGREVFAGVTVTATRYHSLKESEIAREYA